MTNFNLDQRKAQVAWRKENVRDTEKGLYKGEPQEHIISKEYWMETLWSGIRKDLPEYLEDNNIKLHAGANNLVNSWALSANVYFPIHQNEALKKLMLDFLKQRVSDQIVEIFDVVFEFAFPENTPFHPSILLGETGGKKGSGITATDVAFLVKTKTGKGLILTTSKFTEHSFYTCSARRTNKKGTQKGNPDPTRCMQPAADCNYESICHQTVCGRGYWSLLNLSEAGKKSLKNCPAATEGFQLFCKQAFAEGIMKSGDFSLVVSAVAFDGRNEDLKGCLKETGIDDFQTGWGDVFDGDATFKSWTHQDWVQFVRENQVNGECDDWLSYLKERYNY